MRCPIWYYLYNSKNVKTAHGGVLLKPETLLRVTPLHGHFSSFFINGTKSRKASDYKHHRSMKKWVKRENWNIENKWNIFHATFNVIFFSPVLIFKNIKIEVKKRKKSFLKMYFMFTFSQLQKTVTFRRTVCYVYPQFYIWAQKWVNITPASICSVLSTSPLDTRRS